MSEQFEKNIPHDNLSNEGDNAPFKLIGGDKVLWIIIAVLAFISVLVVYSSTAKMAYDINASSTSTGFLIKQFVYLALSICILIFGHHFSTSLYGKYAFRTYLVFLGLTVATYFLGHTTNGAARWLQIGPFNFQPSEGLKIALLIYLSDVLSKKRGEIADMSIIPTPAFWTWGQSDFMKSLMDGFVPVFLPIIVACAVIIPAHTSSALVTFMISIILMIVSCINRREIAKIVIWGVILVISYNATGLGRSDTAGGRVSTWVETLFTDRSDVEIQDITDTERSMIAIHNGGLLGQGAGQSSMRVEMIHPESDYAFAFFVEEYGLILAITLLLLYLWIFFRVMWIYERCNNHFKRLLVLGLGILLVVQALLHILVSINFLPETGQTLPFISRGGSAMLFIAFALTMILSVSRENEEHEKIQ